MTQRYPTPLANTPSRYSSLFSNKSFPPSRRTSTSNLPPDPSPRKILEFCVTDGISYSSAGSPCHTRLLDYLLLRHWLLDLATTRNSREFIANDARATLPSVRIPSFRFGCCRGLCAYSTLGCSTCGDHAATCSQVILSTLMVSQDFRSQNPPRPSGSHRSPRNGANQTVS